MRCFLSKRLLAPLTSSQYACAAFQREYDEGAHYAAAQQASVEQGYANAGLVYDENDGPTWLHSQFDWGTAHACEL